MKKFYCFIITLIEISIIFVSFEKIENKNISFLVSLVSFGLFSFIWGKIKEYYSFKNPRYLSENKKKEIYRVVRVDKIGKIALIPWGYVLGNRVDDKIFSAVKYYHVYQIPEIFRKKGRIFQVEFEEGNGLIFRKIKVKWDRKYFEVLPRHFSVKVKNIEE